MKLVDFLSDHYGNIKITNKLAKKIYDTRIGYKVKNAAFLSQGEIGVIPIRFRDAEELHIFNKVFKVNSDVIRKDMKNCEEIPDFKIQGDLLNITLFYFVHRFLNARNLKQSIRHRAAKDLVLLFCYRTIAAISSKGFTYLANPEAATATYEKLSKKFILKKLRSWERYMDYRADDLLDKSKSVHYKYLVRLSDPERFLRAISDTQGRIKSTFILIYKLYLVVLEDKERITRKSSVSSNFDADEVADVTSESGQRIENIVSSVSSWNSFYNHKASVLVCTLSHNATHNTFIKVLRYMNEAANTGKAPEIHDFIRSSLGWIHEYINASKVVSSKSDIGMLVAFIRSALSSSRSTNPQLLKIREDANVIVTKSIASKDKQNIGMYRSNLLMYLYLISVIKR